MSIIATKENARALRRTMTEPEKRLWRALRSPPFAAHKFRRQVPLGPYVADFLCFGRRLVVEVDGGQHADARRDAIRDRWFRGNGFRTLRFWNNDVNGNLDGVLSTVEAALCAQE